MTYLKLKRDNILYVFFNIIIFAFLIYFSNILITKGTLFIIFISFSLYYFLDIFNFNKNNKLNIILKSFLINFILFTIMTLKIGLKDVNSALIIYTPMFFLHSIIKIIFLNISKQKERILIIGKNYKNDLILSSLKKSAYYSVIGYICNKEDFKKDENIKGDIKNLEKIADENQISVILITTENEFEPEILKKLLEFKLNGIKIYNFTDFYEMIEEKIPVKSINEKWLLDGEGFELFHNTSMQKIKRVVDIFIAVTVLLLTLPFLLLSMIIIKLESKGPIFFIQERVGKGNKEFKILKFRSMRTDAEKDGPKWASKNDNRVTFYGKIMRKTRIDELPQLINVIKGDMSFIGPRPERQYFIEMLEKEIPFYNLRHSVLPGLTGWAQVNYPYGASTEDAFEKLQYDLYYIKNQSLILDIIIVFKTLKVVLGWKGR